MKTTQDERNQRRKRAEVLAEFGSVDSVFILNLIDDVEELEIRNQVQYDIIEILQGEREWRSSEKATVHDS